MFFFLEFLVFADIVASLLHCFSPYTATVHYSTPLVALFISITMHSMSVCTYACVYEHASQLRLRAEMKNFETNRQSWNLFISTSNAKNQASVAARHFIALPCRFALKASKSESMLWQHSVQSVLVLWGLCVLCLMTFAFVVCHNPFRALCHT